MFQTTIQTSHVSPNSAKTDTNEFLFWEEMLLQYENYSSADQDLSHSIEGVSLTVQFRDTQDEGNLTLFRKSSYQVAF